MEKISAKDTSEKVLKSKTYKDLLKCNNKGKKKKNLIKTLTKDLGRHIIKEEIQMAITYLKRCSISYDFREIQINMRYNYIPVKMAETQNTDSILTRYW